MTVGMIIMNIIRQSQKHKNPEQDGTGRSKKMMKVEQYR